jgi:hypothetical protein
MLSVTADDCLPIFHVVTSLGNNGPRNIREVQRQTLPRLLKTITPLTSSTKDDMADDICSKT